MATAVEAPGGWPLVGHAVTLARKPLEFLGVQRACGPVVLIHFGRHPAYIINDPELVRQMLTIDADKVSKGLLFDKLRPLLGNGLLNSEGNIHHRQRRLIQPAFHREQINRYVETISEQTQAVSDRWRHGQVIRAEKEMSSLVIDTITAALFSSTISDRGVKTIQECLPQVLDGTFTQLIGSMTFLEKLPTPGARRFNAAIAGIQGVISEIIRSFSEDVAGGEGLLSMLLAARDEDSDRGMTEEQLMDEVMTLLMAGSDTTTASMNFVFDQLAKTPEVEARLHDELDRVLPGGTRVGIQDLSQLDYTRRVAMEAVRLAAPWLLTRRAEAPLEFAGVVIPPGSDILFSPFAINRDPEIHSEPERFDPDRWLPDRVKLRPRGSLISFGMGKRQCIGESFALTAMTVHIATLCSQWSLRPAGPTRRTVTAGIERTVDLPMEVVSRTQGSTGSSGMPTAHLDEAAVADDTTQGGPR